VPTVMIADFSGMSPLRDPLLLTDNLAQYAENAWLYRGQVRGFRRGPSVHDLTYTDTQQVYRIPLNDDNPPDFTDAGSLWLEFPDPYISIVRNPTVGDTYDRYYFFPSDQYASSGVNPSWPVSSPGPVYNTLARLESGSSPYALGVPAPTVPPTVTPPVISATLTATSPTAAGGLVLNVASTADVLVGMNVQDVTDTRLTASANAISVPLTTVLHFPSTTGILAGMTVQNVTDPAAIYAGSTVASVTGTTVTISTPLALQVNVADSIQFDNTNPIPTTAVISSLTSTQITISVACVAAGVRPGDQIQFTAATPETRAYVYTYVTIFGEEGQPSPATVATGDTTDTWTIVIPPPPSTVTSATYGTLRLYRTVTDASGNATYYQVTEVAINFLGSVTISDNAPPDTITANLILSTIGYAPPPAGLQGVVMMANGIAAGFTNEREIWFSAAYLPHAWPPQYALTVDYPVVGLTANGSSLNIITEGSPFVATGVTPDTMTIGKISAYEPCIGRGSIVSAAEGGYYASPNGIQLLSTGGVENMTKQIYEKEFHNELDPAIWAAAKYGLTYLAFFKGGGIPTPVGVGGEPIRSTTPTIESGFVLDNTDGNVPFSYLSLDTTVINTYMDELSGQIFRIDAGSPGAVILWNPPVGNPGSTTLDSWIWKTKKFRFTNPQQFKAFMILFTIPPEVTITLGVRNTDQAQIFDPSTQYLIIRIYANGQQVVVREIQTSGEVLLVPGGFKAEIWEMQMEGQVAMTFFKVASSVKELKAA
jgi:hypothetical protein